MERGFAADVPDNIAAFLQLPSDSAWAHAAAGSLDTLLIDHANCELKAASTALSLMHRYPRHEQLVQRMSRLAREELRHFEQVSALISKRGIAPNTVSASDYAAGLRREVRAGEPQRLVDILLVGALIEARSCERFALIAPLLDGALARFYRGLLASEARHFEHYLALAETAAGSAAEVATRLEFWHALEQRLISAPASEIRFHSGPPA